MDKIKKIVSGGHKHGDDYLDQDQSTAHNTTGTSNTHNIGTGAAQNVTGTTGTATGYPSDTYTSTAGDTTSSGRYAQGNTTSSNTGSGYNTTGHGTTAQTGSAYPASQGYSSTGNTTSHTTSGYPSQGHTSTGNTTSQTASGYPSQAYSTTGASAPVTSGAGAGYPSGTAGQTGFDSAGKRLSRGPNEGTGISSGLGVSGTGTGNEVFEGGLTQGWGDSGDTGIASGTSGAQSGYPTDRHNNTGTGASNQYTSTNTRSGKHGGQDAAAIGTAGAAGEGSHLHQKNVTDKPSSGTTHQPSSTSQYVSHNPTEGSNAFRQGSHLHRQTGRENLGSDAGYQSTATGQPSGHHLGRDAAIVGSAGAVGAGAYEYREHGNQAAGSNAGYTGNTSGGADRAYAPQYGTVIPGPHATNAANLLDPSVNTSGTGHVEDSHYHSRSRGGGAEAADKAHKKAIVGATRSGTDTETKKHTTTTGRDTTAYGTTTGPYDSTTGSSGNTLGRDAKAGAAGAGVAGLGAAGLHEHRKNEAQKGSSAYGTDTTSTGKDSKAYTSGTGSTGPQAGATTASGLEDESSMSGPAPHTAGPHRYDWLNKLDPRVDANPDTVGGSTTGTKSDTTTGSGHHYGRDAAVGTGVGAAGGAAYDSSKHGHTKTDSGVAGVSSTDKNTTSGNQYSSKPTTTSKTTTSTDKYSSQPSTSHKTGGTTPASNAGYQSNAPSQGYQTTSAGDTANTSHHYGRDAAIAGGGTAAAGAAALGAHEYQGHERTIPLVGKGGQDANDRLQGSSTTAGNTGSTYKSSQPTTQDSDEYGSATVGPTVTYGSGTVGNTTSTTTSNYPSSTTGIYSPTSDFPAGSRARTDQTSSQHQYGRDAAVGAGGVGTAGLAAHELHKHDGKTTSGAGNTQSTGQQRSGVTGSDAYTSGTSSGATGSGVTSSKQGYRHLPSGTPSGVQDSDPVLNKSTSGGQYGGKDIEGSSGQYPSTTGQHGLAAGAAATGTSAALAGGQFGANMPASGNQYATKDTTPASEQYGATGRDHNLTSGTATGVAGSQFGSNAPASSGHHATKDSTLSGQQYGTTTTGRDSTVASDTTSGVAGSKFGSNAPASSGGYNTTSTKTTDPHGTMPGAFPEASAGLDSYDALGSTAQGSQGAGVGAQQYATTKHGPTTVASDETGHSKLHKEPPLEHLARP